MTYTYDALYRLKTAATSGSTQFAAWGLQWTYDRYGNRTAQSVTAGSGPSNSLSISTSTNRITETWASYDSNGNMTNDGLNAMTYNAENRTVTSTGAEYVYDGAGVRVRRCLPNCTSPTSSTVYVFSGTKVIAEYDNGAAVGSPTREYIYLGGQLLAKFEGGTTTYAHHDHLSARVMTNPSGSIVAQSAHFPFGESWYESGGTNKWKFTSYERDSESGNDYAMFRYHINRFGRFSSPDPIAGSILDPQSLNRFSYVANDPVNAIDPLGLAMESFCGAQNQSCGGGGAGVDWVRATYDDYNPRGWRQEVLACNVDPICLSNPPGPFNSPVARGSDNANSIHKAGGGYYVIASGVHRLIITTNRETGETTIVYLPGGYVVLTVVEPSSADSFFRKGWRFGGALSLLARLVEYPAEKYLPPGKAKNAVRYAIGTGLVVGGTIEIINGSVYMTVGAFGLLPSGGVSFAALGGGVLMYGSGVADYNRGLEIVHRADLSRIANNPPVPSDGRKQ